MWFFRVSILALAPLSVMAGPLTDMIKSDELRIIAGRVEEHGIGGQFSVDHSQALKVREKMRQMNMRIALPKRDDWYLYATGVDLLDLSDQLLEPAHVGVLDGDFDREAKWLKSRTIASFLSTIRAPGDHGTHVCGVISKIGNSISPGSEFPGLCLATMESPRHSRVQNGAPIEERENIKSHSLFNSKTCPKFPISKSSRRASSMG